MMTGVPSGARLLVRLFLLAFPGAIRRRIEEEVQQFISDDYQHQVMTHGRSPAPFWVGTLWGLLRNGLGTRLASVWTRAPERQPGPDRVQRPAPGGSVEELIGALRHALRRLARSPAFAAMFVLTLGLGVGGVAVIFSVLAPVLLRPLPYPDAERLVVIQERSPGPRGRDGWVSPLTFRDWRERKRVFEDIVSYRLAIHTWSDGDAPALLKGWAVSAGFFPVMGTPLTLGRGFTPEEDVPGGDPVVVLSHGFWTQAFGADPGILGKTMTLDGVPRTIVGVAGAELEYPSDGAYWYPAALDFTRELRDFRYLGVIGRIRGDTDVEEAQAELHRLALEVAQENPETNAEWDASLVGLKEAEVGGVRPVLLGMAVAVAILLLIAMGNLVNLTIARGAGRKVDAAIRHALGASRTSLAGLYLLESMILGVAGGGLGLLLAYVGLRGLSGAELFQLPRVGGVTLGIPGVAVGLGAAMVVGALLGWVGVLSAGSEGTAETLRAGGAGGTGTARAHYVREAVLTSQMALALTLLIGTALLTRSLVELSSVDVGFEPEGVLTFSYDLPSGTYGEPESVRSFERRLFDGLRGTAGIDAAGVVTPIPMEMGSVPSSWTLPPDVQGADTGAVMAHMRTASPGYFPAMGLGLVKGRLLAEEDQEGGPPVVLVNESFVKAYLGHREPLGVRVTWGGADAPDSDWSTIVGVVKDVRFRSVRSGGEPEIYLPTAALPSTWGHLVVRSSLPRQEVVHAVTEAVRRVDAHLALSDIRSGTEILGSQLRMPRLSVLLTGIFAATATILSMVGILGVLSILVAQRMREIGLRKVLGAGSVSVWRYVLAKAMRPVGVGMALGLAAASVGTRFMESQIFGVSPLDPPAFVLPALGLALAALAACLIPGVRANGADPVTLLKSE